MLSTNDSWRQARLRVFWCVYCSKVVFDNHDDSLISGLTLKTIPIPIPSQFLPLIRGIMTLVALCERTPGRHDRDQHGVVSWDGRWGRRLLSLFTSLYQSLLACIHRGPRALAHRTFLFPIHLSLVYPVVLHVNVIES